MKMERKSTISRIWRYYVLRFKRLRGNPRVLALGCGIGIFIGLTPTMPFHTVMIIFLCLATRSSVIAAIIASWVVCNPLTYFPIYYFSVLLGNNLTQYELNWSRIKDIIDKFIIESHSVSLYHAFFDLGYESLVVLLVGGFVFALPFAIAGYYGSLFFFTRLDQKRKNKKELKKTE